MAGAVPKVGDFGLARALDGEGGLTASGLAMGTPEYMAPEQADRGGRGPWRTSMPWAWSSTSCSPASPRSGARPRSRCSGP